MICGIPQTEVCATKSKIAGRFCLLDDALIMMSIQVGSSSLSPGSAKHESKPDCNRTIIGATVDELFRRRTDVSGKRTGVCRRRDSQARRRDGRARPSGCGADEAVFRAWPNGD